MADITDFEAGIVAIPDLNTRKGMTRFEALQVAIGRIELWRQEMNRRHHADELLVAEAIRLLFELQRDAVLAKLFRGGGDDHFALGEHCPSKRCPRDG